MTYGEACTIITVCHGSEALIGVFVYVRMVVYQPGILSRSGSSPILETTYFTKGPNAAVMSFSTRSGLTLSNMSFCFQQMFLSAAVSSPDRSSGGKKHGYDKKCGKLHLVGQRPESSREGWFFY